MMTTLRHMEESVSGGGKPFAASLAFQDEIIRQVNSLELSRDDRLAHPEIELVRFALKSFKVSELKSFDFYTTVEPCPMCSGAIYFAEFANVVFSVSRQEFQGYRDAQRGPNNRAYLDCRQIICDGGSVTTVVGGVLNRLGSGILARADLRRGPCATD